MDNRKKLEILVDKEDNLTEQMKKEYLNIIYTKIRKHGIRKAGKKIKIELEKKMPKYITESLRLGVKWLDGK